RGRGASPGGPGRRRRRGAGEPAAATAPGRGPRSGRRARCARTNASRAGAPPGRPVRAGEGSGEGSGERGPAGRASGVEGLTARNVTELGHEAGSPRAPEGTSSSDAALGRVRRVRTLDVPGPH